MAATQVEPMTPGTTATAKKAHALLVLYASQTGNAEYIAKNIHQQAQERGFESACLAMDEHEKHSSPLAATPLVLFVSSTTGDGDPPDNSLKFWRFVRKLVGATEGGKPFSGMRYAVLGLGDTNYDNFGAHPKRIDKRMQEMGATQFQKITVADEVEGLENTVDPWIERLWPVLEQECERKSDTGAVNGTAAAIVNQANGNGHNLAAAAPAAATNGNAAATDTVNQALAQLTVSPSTFASHPKLPVDYALLEGVAELTGVAKLPAETCVLTTTGRKVPVPWDGQENARYFTGETKEKAKANGTTVVASPVESDGGTAAVTSSPYTAERPFMARIHGVRCLTTGAAVKRTLHVELDTYGMEWSYTPGDAFGIWAPNDHKLVMSVLERLGVHGDEEVVVTAKSGDPPSHLKSPTTVYDIFRYQVSITSAAIPRKAFYRLLAEYATDLAEKKALLYLSSKQGSDELKRLLSFSPSLFDWLVTFSSVRPDVQRLLDVLLPLVPRHYSITSTPLEHPHHVHCAFNVVEYDRPAPLSDRGHGVCTPWIDTLSGPVPAALNVREPMPLVAPDREVYLPIFPYPSKDFLVPDDDGVPWILIGPGTGIAPFLGFCKHRQLRASPERASSVGTTAGGKKAPVWVFFGCRNADADFLHRDAWEKMLASGTVTKLVTAFSRDEGATPTSKYVQHRLVEHGAAVYGMMVEQQGRIFVCGDAAGMARDVNDALIAVVRDHGKVDAVAATTTVAGWMQEKRYVRDVWA